MVPSMLLPAYATAGHHETHQMPPKGVVAPLPLETQKLGPSCIQGCSPLRLLANCHSLPSLLEQALLLKAFSQKTPVLWPRFTLTPIDIDVVGNTVCVHNKMTGEGLDSETMHMFQLSNGKISSFTAFKDTDSMRHGKKAR